MFFKLNTTSDTASETNNSHFLVQRRQAKGTFKNVGKQKGYGTTIETHEYQYLDQVASTGTYYYRLKQVDHDGTYAYSDVKAVTINETERKANLAIQQIKPNPFTNKLSLQLTAPESQSVTLRLLTTSGVVVKQKQVPSGSSGSNVSWNNLGHLPAGTYMLTASSTQGYTSRVIVKQ